MPLGREWHGKTKATHGGVCSCRFCRCGGLVENNLSLGVDVSKSIRLFENTQFGNVRVIVEDGKPWFCATDVARMLGYDSNPQDAIRRHCKEGGCVIRAVIDGLGREQQTKFINEGNLYRLIASSKLPSAEQFESWIFDEVVPEIRRNGAYLTNAATDALFSDPDTFAALAVKWRDERHARLAAEADAREKQKKIEADAPKVEFADTLLKSEDCIKIGDLAKVLCDGKINIGPKRLFDLLRGRNILMTGFSWETWKHNIPYQQYIDAGYFRVSEKPWVDPHGKVHVSNTTLVTPKGQEWIKRNIAKWMSE